MAAHRIDSRLAFVVFAALSWACSDPIPPIVPPSPIPRAAENPYRCATSSEAEIVVVGLVIERGTGISSPVAGASVELHRNGPGGASGVPPLTTSTSDTSGCYAIGIPLEEVADTGSRFVLRVSKDGYLTTDLALDVIYSPWDYGPRVEDVELVRN